MADMATDVIEATPGAGPAPHRPARFLVGRLRGPGDRECRRRG
ncbi:hypothetical protein ACRAWD_27760 [Caulobacter segnis]